MSETPQYKAGVNVWDFSPVEPGFTNPRYPGALLTNQDLAQHYANAGYAYQSEHLCGRAAFQLYRDGQTGVAVVIPWNENSDPVQLAEVHYRVCEEEKLIEELTGLLDRT